MNDRVFEELRRALDLWAATVYRTREERSRALQYILDSSKGRSIEQFVALSRARYRLATISWVLDDAWYDLARPVRWEKLPSLEDTRELQLAPSAPQPKDLSPPETVREMEYRHGYYPHWLKRDLVDDYFPWDRAHQTLMMTFLQNYTLHDSNLVGLWVRDDNLLAVIQWDPVHVDDEDRHINFWPEDDDIDPLVLNDWGRDVAFWPYLLIRFPHLSALQVLGDTPGPSESDNIIWSATSVPGEEGGMVAGAEAGTGSGTSAIGSGGQKREPLLSVTTLDGGIRKGLRIVHGSQVSILCLNRAGKVVPLPDLQ